MDKVIVPQINETRQKLLLRIIQKFIKCPDNNQIYLDKVKVQYQQQTKNSSAQAIKNLIKNLRPVPIYKKAIKIIAFQFFAWKNSFVLLQNKYSLKIAINIDYFLLSIQQQIPFSVERFQKYDEGKLYQQIESIYINIIKNSACRYQWSNQFIQEWILNKQNQINQNLKKLQEIKAKKRQNNQINKNNRCCICYKNERDSVFIPCGHVVTCLKCIIAAKIKKCPICRKKCKNYKIYY